MGTGARIIRTQSPYLRYFPHHLWAMLPVYPSLATPRGQKLSLLSLLTVSNSMCPVLTTRPKKSPTGDTWVKRWAWIHTQSHDSTTRQHSCSLIVIVSGRHAPRESTPGGSYRRALHQTAMLDGQWRRGHDPNLPGLVGLASLPSLSRPWPPAFLPRSAHGCQSRFLLWPESLSLSLSLGAHRHTRLQHSTTQLRLFAGQRGMSAYVP